VTHDQQQQQQHQGWGQGTSLAHPRPYGLHHPAVQLQGVVVPPLVIELRLQLQLTPALFNSHYPTYGQPRHMAAS
jgi:hypothetical protein